MSLRGQYPGIFFEEAYPVLESLFFNEFERKPDYVSKVLNVKTSDGWGEQTLTMAGLPPTVQTPEGEDPIYERPLQGFAQTYVNVTYQMGVYFTQEFEEDNRLGLMEDSIRTLASSAYQTRQVVGMNNFNNGFSAAGPDGVSLFNANHPYIRGGVYSNVSAASLGLSIAGLEEANTLMERQQNDAGINIVVQPELLIVPSELHREAKELMNSEYRPDGNSNAINAYSSQMEIISCPFLTSPTAWFMTANPRDHKIMFFDRVSPQMIPYKDEKNGKFYVRVRQRFSTDHSDCKGTFGSQG